MDGHGVQLTGRYDDLWVVGLDEVVAKHAGRKIPVSDNKANRKGKT